MSYEFGKKTKGLKYSKYLSACMEDFKSQLSTRERVYFQVKGSNIGHNLQLDIIIY